MAVSQYYRCFVGISLLLVIPMNIHVIFHDLLFQDDNRFISPLSLPPSANGRRSRTNRKLDMRVTSKDDPNTFAACLQIMDDNHFLIEWLAYHYHVLPLRRLIVFVDPHSQTSPAHILKRWQSRINISVWHESDVYPDGIPPPPDPTKKTTKLGEHRARQRRFIRTCLQSLYKEERGWVAVTDSDEYILINDQLRNSENDFSPLNYIGPNVEIPSQQEPGSVMKLLLKEEVAIPHTGQLVHDNPCITMCRKNFGTIEDNNSLLQETVVGVASASFQTFHWYRYDKTFKPGKTLVNLRQLDFDDISRNPSVHRPIDEKCKGKLTVPESKSVIVAHHYPGTLSQMLFRQSDARGDAANATAYRIKRFEAYKEFSHLEDNKVVQEWLQGFVETLGEETAKELLKYVGNPQEAAYDGTGNAKQAIVIAKQALEEIKREGEARENTEPGVQQLDSRNDESNEQDMEEEPEKREEEKEILSNLSKQQLKATGIDDPNTFSSCLQIMDDNHFLIEWLAYHYHVMPLRRLIVLVDPHSSTTPVPILNRWRGLINITVWNETDIFPNGIPPPPNRNKNATKLGQHRARQRMFLYQCQRTLFQEGRSWFFYTDTDEYTMINDWLREPGKIDWNSDDVVLPSQEEPGSVMKLINQKKMKDITTDKFVHDMPCITMARRNFATKYKMGLPINFYGYDSYQLQTLRWYYYDETFKPGKAMVDFSKIQLKDIDSRPSVHRPIPNETICAGKLSVKESKSVFTVNHYPGTLEQMLFRKSDARGDPTNATAYRIQRFKQQKKHSQLHGSTTIRQWLPGFIAVIGEEKARRLLKDVGLPEQAASYIDNPLQAD